MRAVYISVLALFWLGCPTLQGEPSVPDDAGTHAVADNAEPKKPHAFWIIAASDSPENLKAQADSVCAGTNDHLPINKMIAALPEQGGRVHLAAGTFNIGGTDGTFGGISILRSNVLLTGDGCGTRLVLQDGLTDKNVVWINGNISNITIRDLFIDGNSARQVPWLRSRSGWRGGNGVKSIAKSAFGSYPANVRVENCRIENCQLMAVMLSGSCVEVLNCYFTGNFGSHVIELLGHSGRIEGCTLRVKDGEHAGYGFATDASKVYHIVNNKIFIDKGGTLAAHPINNWPSNRYGGGDKTNLYHGIIANNIVINNGTTRSILIDGYMDMVNNNIFRNVPVILGGVDGGVGITFDHNILVNSPLTIDSPLVGEECRIFIDGNNLFNSPVEHKQGNVVWGMNPGYAPATSAVSRLPAGGKTNSALNK